DAAPNYDVNSSGDSVVPGDGQTTGLLNGNPLDGTSGNDIIVGSSAGEHLSGGAGNDILESRGGHDVMTGGDGADTFVLSLTGAANVVTIDDYALTDGSGALAGGDKIDLSSLLDAHFTPASAIEDFVRLVPVGGDLRLQVDTDGPGTGVGWNDVAVIAGGNDPFAIDS